MAGLTVKQVEAAGATKQRRELPDAIMRGLYLIVHPTGKRVWAVRYRLGGRSAKYTIGPYPAFSLKQARDSAATVLRSVAEGQSPKQRRPGSIDGAIAQFLEQRCKHYRARSLEETKRLFKIHVLGRWGGRRIEDINRADVRALLSHIDAPIVANRVHGLLGLFFRWAVENDLIANSPTTGLRPPNKETARDRVLTDDELRSVWFAAEKIGFPFGTIVQLLILTGQRRGEVAGMAWSEIDLDAGAWSLPRERTKNGRPHGVPLSKQAIAIINAVPRIDDRYVFSLNGRAPVRSFSKVKTRLDRLAGVEPWRLHDLRRTCASGMAKIGASLAVIERALNHVSGSFAGIVGVYQRHEYAEEKRAALQKWADHVERLVRP